MTFVVEDGTGKSDAVSWITDTEFVTWAKARGRYEGLAQQAAGERAPFLVQAADYLRNERRFRYRGIRATKTQSLPWPRTGVTDAEGWTWADSDIPPKVKEAQCELAYLAMTGTDLQPALARGGQIRSESVGPLSTTYADTAPTETEFPSVLGLLESLLLSGVAGKIAMQRPYMTDPVTVDGFEGEYAPEDVS